MARITQKDAVIAAIRNEPGITRSKLFDLRVNGARIAGLTARVSEARKFLEDNGETIVCTEVKPLEINGAKIRCTTYEIVPFDSVPTKSVKEFVPSSEKLEELGFVEDRMVSEVYDHPSGLRFIMHHDCWFVRKVSGWLIPFVVDQVPVYPKSIRDVKKIISLITP